MQPQQPYGYQPPQQPYRQPPQQVPQPNPYGQQYQQVQPYPYAQPYPQWWGAPVGEPSGITTLTAAVLGLLIGLTWLVGVAALILTAPEVAVVGMSVTAGIAFALSSPSLIGSVALFARRGFGRWFLVVGLALSVLPSGFIVVASFVSSPGPPQGLLLFAVSVLVFSVGGIVLACSPTTGRYLGAAKQWRGHPAQQAYPQYPQQQPYGYPQPQQGYQPQHPQQGQPQHPQHPQQSQYPRQPGC